MYRSRIAARWTHLMAIVPIVAFTIFLLCQAESSAIQYTTFQSSLRGNPLVIPSGGPLFAGQQEAVQAAEHFDPQAVFARDRSRDAYARLDRNRIARLLAAAFPETVNQSAGGAPPLPAGARVRRFVGAHAVAVTMPGSHPAIVESMRPVARYTRSRQLTPIDLSLEPTSGGYRPASSDVSVRIPDRLAAGVTLPGGVSLRPVDAAGRALQSHGSVDHSTVVYPNVQQSTDSIVKPTSEGFQIDAVLRSDASPQLMRYRVGGPAGSRLALDRRSGVVRVILGHSTIATILPPGAVDAAGSSVPVSMNVVGRMLAVSVPHRAGSYLYPIEVDPEVLDNQLAKTGSGAKSNWEYKSSNEANFGHVEVYEGGRGRLESFGKNPYGETEFGYWAYETKGNSQIYEVKVTTSAKNRGNHIESYLELEHSKTLENRVALSSEASEPEYSEKPSVICPLNIKGELNCKAGAAAANKNAMRFEQQASKASGPSYGFSDVMTEGVVSISEASGEHSTTSFNTTSEELSVEVEEGGKKVVQKRVNVLHEPKGWLSKSQGAFQSIAKDTAIGVATTRLEFEKSAGVWETVSEHHYQSEEGLCQGIQCFAEHAEAQTLNPKLADGEDKVRYRAEEAMPGTVSLASEPLSTVVVKVDQTKPHSIKLHGLPYGNELSEKPYTLSATVIDGDGTTVPSSGVKKLTLFVSGREVAEIGKQTGCTVAKGECEAKAEWSINGAELGAGRHAIVIVAIDNAGNEERLEETVSIRHSTPVALGPGSVDLESGDFTLSATDVSQGSGLTVSRNYSSRATQAGIEGPLGSEWSLSLGKSEQLTELIDGGVMLTSSDGRQSIFAGLGEGKFESPSGDSNLKLELEENKATKEKLAYYLKDPAAGTSDKFTLPAGSKVWVPTKQEGTVATDTVTYTYKSVTHQEEFPTVSNEAKPGGVTAGPDGNLWFTDDQNNKIGKMSPTGTMLAEYATQGATGFKSPGPSIVSGSDGRVWFLEGSATVGMKYKVVKMTSTGVQTAYTIPESKTAAYMVAGPEGNMWFTEPFAKKIGKVTPTGAFSQYAATSGAPYSITFGPDGNIWFTTSSPYKVVKMSTAGTILGEYTPTTTYVGSGAQSITAGPDGNVWFAESSSGEKGKVAKITPGGTITPYTLPGSGQVTETLMTGPDKSIWFSQSTGPNYMGKVNISTGAITEYGLERTFWMTTGPEGNVWYTDNWNKTIDRTTPSTKIVEPTEVLAPVPAGVSCSPTLKAGCRALKFGYSGSASSARLSGISLAAYEPSLKEVRETSIAAYGYNGRGELVEEWDPRYGKGQKTNYGYDPEGHITALTPSGQQTWGFAYGTAKGDAGMGRLVKLIRPPASEWLWNGAGAPENGELPKITGSAYPGTRMTVSDGTWSGNPIDYGYQWIECPPTNELCSPIQGATSASYRVTSAQLGKKIGVIVTVTNGAGSGAARAALSAEVKTRITESGFLGSESQRNLTIGPEGNVWIAEAKNIVKWPPEGSRTNYSLTAESVANGIATGSDGNIWFTEYTAAGVSKIGKITPTGTITRYNLPNGSTPAEITAGPDGNLWFTEPGTGKVGKITTAGVITEYALGESSRPGGIVTGPDGNLWVTEGSKKIAKVTTSGGVTEYSVAEKPGRITAGPDGNLWYTAKESTSNRLAKMTTAGVVTEYQLPSGSGVGGVVAGSDGNMWVTYGTTNKIGELDTSGDTLSEWSLPSGSDPIAIIKGSEGNLWFGDWGSDRVGKVALGTEGAVRTPARAWMMEYATPLTGGSGLPNMTVSEVAKWGQTDDPVEATAIIPPDADQGWPASSYQRATVYYLDAQGRAVNVAKPSNAPYGSVTTTEYNEFNDTVRTLTPDNRQTALEAGPKSVEVSKLLDTVNTYNGEGAHESEVEEPGTRLIDVIGPQHNVKYTAGGKQYESLARLHTKYFYDEGAPSGTYDLVTKETTLAQLANEEEVEVRKTTKSYSGQSNLGWKLRAPTSVTADPEGKKLTTTIVYSSTTGQIVETQSPAGAAGSNAHDHLNVYYSSEANTEGYSACGGHPEWAGLLCETLPAKQPISGGLPQLPVTTVSSYNKWNEPLVVTETFGSTVRTKTNIYASGERLTSSETTSSAGTALPQTNLEYDAQSGLIQRQWITAEGKEEAIRIKRNTLGQVVEYTDADGNIAKYRYGGLENDDLLEEVADGSSAGTGKQTYTYNSTTKALEELTDSSAGVFKASYDANGALTSEVYPNAMCANVARNSVGEETQLEYIKTATCSEHGALVWFSEARTPTVRGETDARTSTLGSETYGYDSIGRLTETQETPSGKDCTTRLYAYDEESNRLSLTTRAPGAGGECTTSGGTTQNHTYDEGNRLTDAGIAYDAFGNVTALPAADAEGHELTSTFYVDNAVASQTQNGVSIDYLLDPEGRVRESLSGVTGTVDHYDASGEGVAWTSETGGQSTRNIPGIDGALAATQKNSEAPVLQLHDIQGDVVATAALSPTETKLLSTYNSTEFGVPNEGKAPPKFAWLGASDVASAFSSGVITYGATSYVPQTGRALQSEAVDPPGAPNGTGGGSPYTSQEEPWVFQGAAAAATEAPGREAARERAAAEAAAAAAWVDPPEVHYMNKTKARGVAEKLWEAKTAAELAGALAIPTEWIGSAVGIISGLGMGDIYNWFNETAEMMSKCGNNKWPSIDGVKPDICKIEYDVVHAAGRTFVNFGSSAKVWECFDNSGETCFHEVYADKKEKACTLGIICIA